MWCGWSEYEVGKVLVGPPARLGSQLAPDWKFDPDLITEVEVRFIPEGDGPHGSNRSTAISNASATAPMPFASRSTPPTDGAVCCSSSPDPPAKPRGTRHE
jgi:hypothetical protein